MKYKTCEVCTANHTICEKCEKSFGQAGGTLPPPFGSLNSADPVSICHDCNQELAVIVFEWLGKGVPESLWQARLRKYQRENDML